MLKSVLQSRWFTFAAVIVIGFFLLLIVKLKPSLETVNQKVNNLDQKIAEAEKSRLELEKLGDYLKNAAYLEQQARLKLNYKKP
ncbi:MAG: septum formation initiator family protein, partial [Patescibacteria group bacterium]